MEICEKCGIVWRKKQRIEPCPNCGFLNEHPEKTKDLEMKENREIAELIEQENRIKNSFMKRKEYYNKSKNGIKNE